MKHLSTIILFLLISLSGVTAMTQTRSKLPVHIRDRWSTSTKSVREIPVEAFITDSMMLIIHFKSETEVTLDVKGPDGEVVYTRMVFAASGEELTIDLSNASEGDYELSISGRGINAEGDFNLD